MTQRDVAVSLATVFNINVPAEVQVKTFPDTQNVLVPKKDDEYVFRRENLRDVLHFLNFPHGDGMYLFGPHGSGKTSLPYQVASRLNWPLQAYTAHNRMEFDDLVGTWKMVNGTMQFLYGPLANAMRDGHIFVLNEIDRADPGQLAGLHDILEGHPLVIATNGGEVIHAHPNFRFIATGNSAGCGDSTGLYPNVNQMDMAFMDRMRVAEVQYPDSEVELAMLAKRAPELPEELRQCMVRVANTVRKLFIGGEETATPLTTTISPRALTRWARLTVAFRNAPNAISYALNHAFLAKAEPEQKIAIEQIAKDIFGSNWGAED